MFFLLLLIKKFQRINCFYLISRGWIKKNGFYAEVYLIVKSHFDNLAKGSNPEKKLLPFGYCPLVLDTFGVTFF